MSDVGVRPRLVVFDLDYTLWPFWIDTHVSAPFHLQDKQIVDSCSRIVSVYPESELVLSWLHEQGFQLAVASRTAEVQGANQLLEALGWNRFFSYKEIYPGSKKRHFAQLRVASGLEYRDMLFFDDEQRNVMDLQSTGVLSVLVRDGLTSSLVKDALYRYSCRPFEDSLLGLSM